jgi:hypothetical protein
VLRRTVGSLALAGLLVTTSAVAQQVTAGQNISITLHGIFSGSLFAQDADFGTGNGQKAEFVTAERNKWVHGGDVRNMRLSLAIAGPEVRAGWRANATVEMDFFGAFTGTGNFADEQPQPRLRTAYVDLASARTILRIGQDWSPTLGNIPQSTSHIGFPLGWGSGGFVGWRFMQVKLIRTLSKPGAATTKRVQLAVMNGSWTDEAGGGDNTFSAGERSLPQVEARFDYSTARWAGYLVGHIDTKDIPGPDLTSRAIEAGVSTTRGDLTIAANGYYGKAMGHQFAQVVQFGDIKGWGAWGQLGYNVNARWSLWGFYGTERPNETDITNSAVTDATGAAIALAARRFSSWLFVPMLRYKSGPYALGLEWLHNEVQVGPSANNKIRSGNQVLLSARLDF